MKSEISTMAGRRTGQGGGRDSWGSRSMAWDVGPWHCDYCQRPHSREFHHNAYDMEVKKLSLQRFGLFASNIVSIFVYYRRDRTV